MVEPSELEQVVAYALRNGMMDLGEARVALARERVEFAQKLVDEKAARRIAARREHTERLKGILSRNPTRFCVSIGGKLVLPDKKGALHFECPSCKAEIHQILQDLGSCMERTFEKFWSEDFSNGNGRLNTINTDTTCSKCSQRVMYRCLALPF